MEHTKTDTKEYKTGRVYSIRSFNTDKIYIGSTFQSLGRRLCGHRGKYKRWCDGKAKCSMSRIIFEAGNPYIELITEVQVKNRDELNKYEGESIRANMNIIVNKCIAGRTTKEYQKENSYKKNEQRKKNYLKKMNCLECNESISKGNLKRHLKSIKHINNSNTEI